MGCSNSCQIEVRYDHHGDNTANIGEIYILQDLNLAGKSTFDRSIFMEADGRPIARNGEMFNFKGGDCKGILLLKINGDDQLIGVGYCAGKELTAGLTFYEHDVRLTKGDYKSLMSVNTTENEGGISANQDVGTVSEGREVKIENEKYMVEATLTYHPKNQVRVSVRKK